ncbi:hypothetical protein KUV26_16990 [Leisingera daeponensis]|uniref:Uncharacterized protein n=1 Tax=Leisingera daeponensis TaxID=405746 RepID=A0ABS7NIW5_9RHOB|nr:hypothetical protein [Leisingera daeponensis]MBY6141135.1 hypothetical protein [Leisingera daeponensis]
MNTCKHMGCRNCNCGRFSAHRVANANFAPKQKPKKVVRRDPLKAAAQIEQRFKETMQILS